MKKHFIGFCLFLITMIQAQTQIIAHRGYWQTKPATTENSIEALKNAQALKIYGAEFDVRMSRDGVLIINHDEHHGEMEISETDFNDLQKLRLSNGESLPTLKSYLEQGKQDPTLHLIIELKPLKSELKENELVQTAIQLVKDLQVEGQSEFISFSLNICRQIKKVSPGFKVQYLNGDLSPVEIKKEGFDGLDYHYKIYEKNPSWIAEAKTLNLITNSWTVNDPKIFQQLKNQGIDFITTNIPNELKNK